MQYGPAPPDEGEALPTRCIASLSGHEGSVLNVRYNASGGYALSCGKDRTVRLWSLAKAALIKTYAGHGHEARLQRALLSVGAHGRATQVRDVACSEDNSKLASVGGDKQACSMFARRLPASYR